MSPTLPDPLSVARAEADRIRSNPHMILKGAIERVCADAPWADPAALTDGLEAFHKKRMANIPSYTKYPEAKPFVEHTLTVDRELQKLAGLSDFDMGVYCSLVDFLTYRGYRQAAAARKRSGGAASAGFATAHVREKCRVAYIPDTDRGQLHIKNVDDPPTFWRCRPGRPEWLGTERWEHLTFDGVGSGLHLDTEPEDIFPLNAQAVCQAHCDDTPGAVQFLTRYKPFYGGGNFVVHDGQNRSVAIEHCSRNFIEVFGPGPSGRSHVSGMCCRDPQSPQGKHQRAMRDEFLRIAGLPNNPMDTPDVAFWNACDRTEQMLADYLTRPESSRVDHVFKFFLSPFPNGLNKNGVQYHPAMTIKEYTLVTHGTLIDRREYIRYQRSDPPELKMATEPEVYRF